MYDKVILPVHADPADERMTLYTLEEANFKSEVVARYGEEALDYLFVGNAYANKDARAMPQMVLLEPKLPTLDGFEVLEPSVPTSELSTYPWSFSPLPARSKP